METDTDTHQTSVYPTERQYRRWERRADERGMSVAEFVKSMTEAGLKKFDATTTPDETVQELRKQRNDLKTELRDARDRIARLEDELHGGERAEIRDYVRQNPGATYDEIIQHIIDTAPSRVTSKLDTLEGDVIRVDGDGYYPIKEGGGE